MNVAILFDSAEDGEVRVDTLLAGKELYSYSFKTFYLHPGIDYIIIMWRDSENAADVEGYIGNWKEEYGVDKPVKVYQEGRNLRQVIDVVERNAGGKQDVELYVLHDIRYPFATADMIYRVAEKAALYGVAVTAGVVKDDLAVCMGQDDLAVCSGHGEPGMGGFRYAGYPVAVRAGHGILDGLTEVDGALWKCAGWAPYLCGMADMNLFVGGLDGIELVEAILQTGSRDEDKA